MIYFNIYNKFKKLNKINLCFKLNEKKNLNNKIDTIKINKTKNL